MSSDIHDLEMWLHGSASQLDVAAQEIAKWGHIREQGKRIPLKGEGQRFSVHVRVAVALTAPPAGTPVRKATRARKAAP